MSNLKWVLLFDKKELNPMTKLAGKLNNSPYWFMPERMGYLGMGLESFRNHMRKLARHYHADTITIKTLEHNQYEDIVRFRRDYLFREKYLENTDQSEENIVYDFWLQIYPHTGLCLPEYKFLYSNQIFPELSLKEKETIHVNF